MLLSLLLPPTLPCPAEEPPAVHYCRCGAVIGDGDWAHGRRRCARCRRPPKRWTALPTPRR